MTIFECAQRDQKQIPACGRQALPSFPTARIGNGFEMTGALGAWGTLGDFFAGEVEELRVCANFVIGTVAGRANFASG